MGKLKNYLLATAGLVILGGAVQLVMPLQAASPTRDVNIVNTAEDPVPVVVENGNGNDTMVITLAENFTGTAEFDAVDTSGFRFVSFHGIDPTPSPPRNPSLVFRFSTSPGKISDFIPKTTIGNCSVNTGGTACNDVIPRVAGPFLLVRIQDAINTTLQVFLSR